MSDLEEFRQAKDHFMGHDSGSPLTQDQKATFSGLKYFTENSDLRFELPVEIFDSNETVEMQTSTGDVAEYLVWGKIQFDVEGESAQLTIFSNTHGHGYFLPFTDATSGEETYGAGRYVEIDVLEEDGVAIDFNMAYNPYCAYNEDWSCPLTPFENRLQVTIRAGEMKFK